MEVGCGSHGQRGRTECQPVDDSHEGFSWTTQSQRDSVTVCRRDSTQRLCAETVCIDCVQRQYAETVCRDSVTVCSRDSTQRQCAETVCIDCVLRQYAETVCRDSVQRK